MYWRTSNEQIERISDGQLKQITSLNIYGLSESCVFGFGIWGCTQLCRSSLDSDDVRIVSSRSCPDTTIYEPNAGGNTAVRIQGQHLCCSDRCSDPNTCRDHRFISLALAGDVEKAQKDLGWDGLTKNEIVGMLTWYKCIVEPRHGRYMGRPWVEFDEVEVMRLPGLSEVE